LIGSYVCSDVPGEFIWKPGPLYQAAVNGDWLLLEDLDSATPDSMSILIYLLETSKIKTDESTIRINANFRLFSTQRTRASKMANSNMNYLNSISKLSRCIKFKDLTVEEIINVSWKFFFA
jgi:midasin